MDALGSIPDRNQTARMYTMRRRIFLGRMILIAFLLYSACLPFDHTCYEGEATSRTSGTGTSCAVGPAPSAALSASTGAQSAPGDDGTCLACLWSHTLMLSLGSSGAGIPQLISSDSTVSSAPVVLIVHVFDSASKRGPPLSSAS